MLLLVGTSASGVLTTKRTEWTDREGGIVRVSVREVEERNKEKRKEKIIKSLDRLELQFLK